MNEVPALTLRDIHEAPVPAFWPPALGWWVLTLSVLVILIVLVRLLYRRYRRWRRQRVALKTLAQLRETFARQQSTNQLAADLSILLRRVALSRFPRNTVAGLYGTSWLTFLDETGGGGRFASGPGKVLITAPYAPSTEIDVENLCLLVRDWVKQNS